MPDIFMNSYKLGIDIGSTTVKIALIDDNNTVIFSDYERHFANIQETLQSLLEKAVASVGNFNCHPVITGSGGLTLAKHLEVPFTQEVVAVSTALQAEAPQCDVAIELGGEDAKIIYFTNGVDQRMKRLSGNAVMRGGDDDAAVGLLADHGHLGPGGGAQPDVDDVRAAGQQGPFHEVRDHFARNTGVASYDYGKFFARIAAGDQAHVGRGEFDDVGRRQVLARGSADRAADARNGFDECHVLFGFTDTYIYEKFASKF